MEKEDMYCIAPVIAYEEPYMVSGDGCYVTDQKGKRYLDISCGQFSAVLGHNSPYVRRAADRAGSSLVHLNTGLISENFIECARSLHQRMPGMNSRILLLSTGGEANEACLRYAKNMNHNKPGVISFAEGYHGLTHGTEGYSIARKWVKPPLEHSYAVHAPRILCLEEKVDYTPYLEEFRKTAATHQDVVAAALFEPVVSNGGLLFPGGEYWRGIRRICDEYGIFLIFDECQTGFGRTGSWFYYEQLGCVPDMLVCGKAMGLGFPVSMVAFNGDRFDDGMFQMHHFSSHQNEPFSAELVLGGIEAIEEQKLLDNIKRMGACLVSRLKSLQAACPIIQSPRGIGLMCGFDLASYDHDVRVNMERGDRLTQIARDNGLLLQITNGGVTVRIMPAYRITEEEIDVFIELLRLSLEELGRQGYRIGDR